MELHNKVAIITGASQGMGKEILMRFVKEGASCVICARNQAELELSCAEANEQAAPGQRVICVRADVSKEAEARSVVERCMLEFGRVDILVNNAAVHGAKGDIDQLDLDEWKLAIEVNLYGTVHMIRSVLPHMRPRGGKIINISGGGATSARPFFSAYAASKTAIVRLTENFAVEWQGLGIDINAIAPGAMNTRLLDDILSAGKIIGAEYEKAKKQKEQGGVSPEVGAALCVYLASSKSNGISGRLFSAVWDHWDQLDAHRDELKNSDIYTLRRITAADRGKTWDD